MLRAIRGPHELKFGRSHQFLGLACSIHQPPAEPTQRLGVARPVSTLRAVRLDVPLAIRFGGLGRCRGTTAVPTYTVPAAAQGFFGTHRPHPRGRARLQQYRNLPQQPG